jgi:hypothetical protein
MGVRTSSRIRLAEPERVVAGQNEYVEQLHDYMRAHGIVSLSYARQSALTNVV